MEDSTNSQPRDSRLEKFSAAASQIISIERGLTSAALDKIGYLATEQHLSEDQVIECLDRIGDGNSTLGRVGRYEQMFLDRMANDLTMPNGNVLSPQTAQEAIRLATDEYQISVSRAQQLLDHAAKERGLQQVSAADAQNQIRRLIAEKLVSPDRQREDFENELVYHAANFGISADEVSLLIDKEFETRNQLRADRDRRLIVVAVSILTALCAISAGCWLWLNSETTPILNQSPTELIVGSTSDETKDAETETIPEEIDRSQNGVKIPTKDLSLDATEAFSFDSDEFMSIDNSTTVLKFERWQERFVELASQDFEQSLFDTPPSPLADRQKKQEAIEALQAEPSDERIQTRALEDLSAVAKRIDDITPEEAKTIAAFCFRKHDALLQTSIVRNVKQFGRWPHFLLAVSDTFAANRQPSPSDEWQQRVALAITDGKLKNNGDISESLFAMARLRVEERLIAIKQVREAESINVERAFISHLRQFIFGQMDDRAHQSYFNRLIDARDLDLPSMQRQIELQQILIEVLLFAKPDDESLAAGELHFRNLNSAATLGAQLAQSRQTSLRLVALHLDWLKRDAVAAGQSNPMAGRSTEKARRLRDRAEEAVISGNDSLIEPAIKDYRSAITCGDRAIIRSCLRGLIGIAETQTDRNRYQRQLDFVNGGQQGPYSRFGDDSGEESSSTTDLQAIRQYCRQIRQSSIPQETSAKPVAGKPTEIWAALNWLANRQSPQSIVDLNLLLRIEAEATAAMESGEASLSADQLPWSIQAMLPPVDVTPLLPLPR